MADKKTLTGVFFTVAVAAVTGIATGFVTEFFTFPFYHNSTLGAHFVAAANEWILPSYEAAAGALGITAPLISGTEDLINSGILPEKSY